MEVPVIVNRVQADDHEVTSKKHVDPGICV